VSRASETLFPQPLLDVLENDPDRAAIEHGSRLMTRGELLALVRRMASGFRSAGIGPGHGVAVITAMTPESFAANLAAHAAGCRVVGVRPAWSAPLLGAVLAGGTDAVVGDPSTLTPELLDQADAATVFSLGGGTGSLDLLAAVDDGERVDVHARPDDIARLNFTSGSTGLPKGCARTYRTFSLAYRSERWAPDLARLVGHFDRFLAFGSFSLPVMLTFAGRSLITGGTVVIADGDPRSELAPMLDRHGITAVVMPVPSLQQLLSPGNPRPDLSALRAVVVTGSPATPQLLEAAVERLGPIVWQGYGQAESGMIALLTPDDIARSAGAALASVGRVLPEVEVGFHAPDGPEVAAGAVGEICVRSPHMMQGYWRDPVQTAEVLRDGWLHTRDLGRLDATGFLRLAGRTRDVIMVNAEVCYAGVIERLLARHADIDQAYVVGAPDDRTGEAIHAFVVPAAGRSPDRKVLDDLVRSELTPGHVPTTTTVLEDVPLVAGKPDKQALAESVSRRRP
jgi:acyl-CoA synthetase (AMP-forming)/AMP-acid ligase II